MSNPINLLILTSEANEAEGLITELRNRGLPVRGTYTYQPERLAELAAEHPCDLILCCVYDPQIDLQATMNHHQGLGLDIPLLLIDEADANPEPLLQALRSGARDLIGRHDPARLHIVVTREFGDLQQRRALAETREQLERCEQRTRDLVEASTEPFAFVQQGMHVLANPVYRTDLRIRSGRGPGGHPVSGPGRPGAARDGAGLPACPRDGTGTAAVEPTCLACLRTDGSRFDAEIRAARAEMDGEPCLRLTVKTMPEPGSAAATAEIDPDTGLPCRAALMHEIHRRISAGRGAPLALIYLGLLGLDRIAQRDGLCTAFEVSAGIARSLPNQIPVGGYLARVGDGCLCHPGRGAGSGRCTRHCGGPGPRGPPVAWSLWALTQARDLPWGLALAGPQGSSATDLLNRAWADAHSQSVRHPPASRRPGIPP